MSVVMVVLGGACTNGHGSWDYVYIRFRRRAEQGVLDALLQTPESFGLKDGWQPWLPARRFVPICRPRVHSQGVGRLCSDLASVLALVELTRLKPVMRGLKPDRPEAGNAIVKVVRAVLRSGVETGHLSQNVAKDVAYIRSGG